MCASNSASGSNSIFAGSSTITSTGGGRGGTLGQGCGGKNACSGGSGGGAAGLSGAPSTRTGGSGNTPPVSPAQGTDGGTTPPSPGTLYGSSGGGATVAGTTSNNCGGTDATSSITGSPVGRAGGGGGRSTGTPAAEVTVENVETPPLVTSDELHPGEPPDPAAPTAIE